MVIEDLASCYPIVKLVKSTSAKLLILVLEDVYDTSGNPIRQKCDNGPPLNSKKMENFAKNRNNEQFKTPPGHFSSNNVETVMKPLGIVMKISLFQNQGKKGTLSSVLVKYCDTRTLQQVFLLRK